MSTNLPIAKYSLSEVEKQNKSVAIITATFNSEITEKLREGAYECLVNEGVSKIYQYFVPGSFELPLACKWALENIPNCEAVIALGCLIKGDTPHFHYISDAVSKELSNLSVLLNRPVIFGVLTVETFQQAIDRCTIERNVGRESAQAALQMLALYSEMSK